MSTIVFTRLAGNSSPSDITKANVYVKSIPTITGSPQLGKAFLRLEEYSAVSGAYDMTIQPHIGLNRVSMLMPYTGAGVNQLGMGATLVGTVTTPALATTNKLTQTKRTDIATTAATNNPAYVQADAFEALSSSTANTGGSFTLLRFGFSTLPASGFFFAGLTSLTTPVAGTNYALAATLAVRVGFCSTLGATPTGSATNIISANGTTGTLSAALSGITADPAKAYEVILHQLPGDIANFTYRVSDLISGGSTRVNGTITATLPPTGNFLKPCIMCSSLATSAASSVDLIKIYMETDD